MFCLSDFHKMGYIIHFQYIVTKGGKNRQLLFGMLSPSSMATLERKMNV